METYLKKLTKLTVLTVAVINLPLVMAEDNTRPQSFGVKTQVIEDRGGQSIDHYLPHYKRTQERIKQRYRARQSTKLVNAHFPVVTTSMRIGRVTKEEARNVKYQMAARPMFILGYDPVSIDWLKQNRALLAEKKAIGLVVNVQNKAQMNRLQTIAGSEVLMQPAPGDRLSKSLKITHYPFYMDNTGVMR